MYPYCDVERRKWVGGVEEMKVALRIMAPREFIVFFSLLGYI